MSSRFEYYNNYNFYGFQQFEFLEDKILCSIGVFAGTGNIYQGGIIASVKKDGTNFEVLVGSKDEFVDYEFYVLEKIKKNFYTIMMIIK